ncbi:hypothetical protein OHC33_005546 [Knufia fluminis]|uniref:Uncharacterized protein n=1 Tax=Knufia fluminis TaxID=191047 RepID=A0AAN8IMV8_9EURO|nr:hypothetical protein OHC33_005546 [Knufia fluminis]
MTQNAQPAVANTHRHSRTVSSSTLPANPFAAPKPPKSHRHSYMPSTSTRSTSSQPSPKSPANMHRQGTTGSTSNTSLPRRSTSNRSVATNSPTSYVTLMRKQKATVWCDRSQSIDARMAAQQKAAKQRAVLEVVGTNSQRTSTINSGGMVGKIRHGGVPKAQQYTSPNLSGVNVPTRLLAFDMQGEDEPEGRVLGDNSMVHARTGSGKSSIHSAKYRSGYPRAHATPPDSGSPAHEGIPEAGETPHQEQQKENYFENSKPRNTNVDSEEEDSFGELKEMAGPNSKQHALDQKAKEEDLRRRGSVDERTTTMKSTQRLFIANPDIDSD